MIDRIKLLDALLDNQDLSDEALVILVEGIISEGLGFSHSEKDVKLACKISRTRKDFGSFKERDKVSQEVEDLEKSLTKREIAYLTIMTAHKSKKMGEMDELLGLLKMLKDRGKKD